MGGRATQAPRSWMLCVAARGSERRGAAAVSPSDGAGADREGHREVGAAHSTRETGEPVPPYPVKERAVRGFRPGRSAHQAVYALRQGIMAMYGGCTVEVDIKSFFDNIYQGHLRSLLDRRVRDGVNPGVSHRS